jgi:hypothetical protein
MMEEISYSSFIVAALAASLPLIIIYSSLGYFFGSIIQQILLYVKVTEYAIAIESCSYNNDNPCKNYSILLNKIKYIKQR